MDPYSPQHQAPLCSIPSPIIDSPLSAGPHRDEPVDVDARAPAPKKRRKSSVVDPAQQKFRRTRGRGKLRQLPEMPLDILYEVFGHLDPFDLLHLARTTKTLRRILMTRSVTFLWKEARSNIDGFPPCPPDLAEPQYANLAFDSHCYYCLSPHTPKIMWACRVRCCKNCLPEEFVPEHRLYMINLPPSLFRFLSSIYHEHDRIRCRRNRQLFSIRQAVALGREYEQVRGDPVLLQHWEETKHQAALDRQVHAALCERWQSDWNSNRSQELHNIRQRRKEAIFAKLTEIGWGTELDKLIAYNPRTLLEHTLVKQPKDLTMRIWTNIMPSLVEFLEDIKAKRLQRERQAAIKKRSQIMATILDAYLLTRPLTEVIPCSPDVCEMKGIKAVIEDTPVEVEVTKENFREVARHLPRLCQEWRLAKSRELIMMMKAKTGMEMGTGMGTGTAVASTNMNTNTNSITEESHVDLSSLVLATTWFLCASCTEPIGYPRVLAHYHATLPHSWGPYALERSLLNPAFLDPKVSGREPWNHGGDKIKCHPWAHQAAKPIVEACGLDPGTATAREMDDLNPMIECLACCDKDTGKRLVMRWRRAVYHSVTVHLTEDVISWVLLTPLEKREAENAETTSYSPLLPDLACMHCRQRSSLSSIQAHVTTKHGKLQPSPIDYFLHIDASINTIPLPVKLNRMPAIPPLYFLLTIP